MRNAAQRHKLASMPLPVVRYIGHYGVKPETDSTAPKYFFREWRGHSSEDTEAEEWIYLSENAWKWLRAWSLAQLIEDGVVTGHAGEVERKIEEDMSESRLGMRTTLCSICGVEFFGYGQDGRPVTRLGTFVCDEPRVEDGETIQPCAPGVLARRRRDVIAKKAKAALEAAKEETPES